jgi:hypothetical protein
VSEVVVHDDLHSTTTSCDPRPKMSVVPVVSATTEEEDDCENL